MDGKLPPRLEEIVEDFQMLQGTEKLEYLLELAEGLPPLPERLVPARNANEGLVNECMTPVFVYVEAENSHLQFFIDAPPESPTIRGFAALMQKGASGLTPEEITAIPDTFYLDLGLQEVLSGQRMNGMGAIVARVKELARAHRAI